MPKSIPAEAKRYQRDRYARLIAEGIRPQCAKRGIVAGKSRCPDCARKAAQVNRRLQQGRKARGVCAHCGNPRGRDGTATLCRRCAANMAARMRNRSEARQGFTSFDVYDAAIKREIGVKRGQGYSNLDDAEQAAAELAS